MKAVLTWLGFHVKHSFGVPKRNEFGVWVLPCFECGREQPLRVELEVK